MRAEQADPAGGLVGPVAADAVAVENGLNGANEAEAPLVPRPGRGRQLVERQVALGRPRRRILARLATAELPSRERLEELALGNSLYENTGGGYREVSAEAGPFPAGWAWGGGFFDLDNDGFEDLFTPNGFISGSKLHDT